MKAQTQSEYAIVEERLSKQSSLMFSAMAMTVTQTRLVYPLGWSGTKIKDYTRMTMSVSGLLL